MRSRRRLAQDGFTIIEALVVLAIGGIIFMIVFQAVPTLQRNSRNNQRKQDVTSILSAISHYELNNSGNILPSGDGQCGGGGQTLCVANGMPLFYISNKLTIYEPSTTGTVRITALPLDSDDTGHINNPNNISRVSVYNRKKCDTDGAGGATGTAAGYRDVVALYTIERGNGGTTRLCQQL
jgi:prepilin-type N-terminal cleavage/methylation domain-containing protein